MPADAVHREKWRLGMEMIDETLGWGVTPPLIVADAGYGDAAEFRQGLDDRALSYVVGVNCAHTAFTVDTQRTAPPTKAPVGGRR
jgi:SRSO17 transposase